MAMKTGHKTEKEDIADVLARYKRQKDHRRNWESLWQELAEVMLPFRADFTAEVQPGEKRVRTYDSAPMLARRGLAAAIDGLLKPRTTQWFHVKAADESLNGDDEVKAWLDETERRMTAAIYGQKARFIQRTGEVDDDLVTFGTGCLFIGEGRALDRLLFRSIHLKDVFPVENADGEIDTVHVRMMLTARQAAQRYGEDAIGEKTREALQGPHAKPDDKFEFAHVVEPREDREPGSRKSGDLRFASRVIDVGSEHKVGDSGYHEFPFAIPRWDTASGEVFGRSPGMLALPDAKTLQEMGKTILVAGQKAVDPPLIAVNDAVIGTARTFPGGISYVDAEAIRDLGGTRPLAPLDTGGQIPLGREMQNDVRDQIWAAFFRNVLQLPVDAPKMTATEVLERKEEFIRTIGPVFGRLEADYVAPIVERVFNIMRRAGALPEMPEVLTGRGIRFAYASPVEQARRQIEAAGAARSLELLAPFVSVDPSIMDNFDGDAIARDVPDIFGVPRRWLRPDAQVAAIRAQRAEVQQASALLAGANQAADVAGKIATLWPST